MTDFVDMDTDGYLDIIHNVRRVWLGRTLIKLNQCKIDPYPCIKSCTCTLRSIKLELRVEIIRKYRKLPVNYSSISKSCCISDLLERECECETKRELRVIMRDN